MNGDILRIIEAIHRERSIDKEVIFLDLESAMVTAARKKFGTTDDIQAIVDRSTGVISVYRNGVSINPDDLGRIAAQTAKQVMIQRFKEAQRDVLFDVYRGREGELVNGAVQRFEGPNLIVNLGDAEGVLPKKQQIFDESYRPGETLRAIILEVKRAGQKVSIILSRTHTDFVRRLFELEVPEIADRTIRIMGLVREAGYRSKIAVSSTDAKIDCVGACVGVRGSRIKNIVDELNGEKIDIVRWNDLTEILISNALRPAEVDSISLSNDEERAIVYVGKEQLSLAIGKGGQNVRLASHLTGWDIDIEVIGEDGRIISRSGGSVKVGPGAKVDKETVEKADKESGGEIDKEAGADGEGDTAEDGETSGDGSEAVSDEHKDENTLEEVPGEGLVTEVEEEPDAKETSPEEPPLSEAQGV